MVFTLKFGMVGMYLVVKLLCGGYGILFHLVLSFTGVLRGVGGVFLYVVLRYLHVFNSCLICVYLVGCAKVVILVVNT